MNIDDFEDSPFGRFDEQPDAGAAADSADSEKAIAQLPRLLRHALLSQGFRPVQRQRLMTEICDLAPNLCERAQAWSAGRADHDGVAFAATIDLLAAERDHPALRSVADSLRVVSLPARMSVLPDLRRVANALSLASHRLSPDLPPKIREQILTLVLGWTAVAAGSIDKATSEFTHAIDAAWSIGRSRMHDIRSALDDERSLEDAKRAKRATTDTAPKGVAAPEAPVQPGFVRVARVPAEALKWAKTKELVTGLNAVLQGDLQLTRVPDLHIVTKTLEARFPHARNVFATLLGDLVNAEYVQFRPTIITGAPGAGKTSLIREMCEALGIGYYRVDASRTDSAAFAGQDRRWSSAEPCHPVLALAQTRKGSTCIAIDEIEKAGSHREHGGLWTCLLPFTEFETARNIIDPALQVSVDLSTCSYLCTANDTAALPSPLRDRFRIVALLEPGPEHLSALLPGVVAQITRNRVGDPSWLAPLGPDDLAWLAQAWGGGSIRKLTRLVEALLTASDMTTSRH